jgi:hypothetical protein
MIVYVPGNPERFIDCTAKGADAAHQTPLGLAGRDALILEPGNPHFRALPSLPERASTIKIERHLRLVEVTDVAVDETLALTGVHAAYMRDFLLQIPVTSRRNYFQGQAGLADAELLDFQVEGLESPETDLSVHCLYRMKKQFHKTGARLGGVLRAGLERGYLAAEPVDKRTSPFEIATPIFFKSRIIVDAPKGYRADRSAEFSSKVDGRFASGEGRARVVGPQLTIELECQQLPGNFQAADYDAYRDSMAQVLALLERDVSFSSAEE